MMPGPPVAEPHLAKTLIGTSQLVVPAHSGAMIHPPPMPMKGEGSGALSVIPDSRPWDAVSLSPHTSGPMPVARGSNDYRVRPHTTWIVLSLVLLSAAVALVVYVVMTT
jgi:hypothetical protein